jgi:hypothetical protein
MKIALWISSHGGSPLQVGLDRGLKQLGHQFEYYRHGQTYDLVLIKNQVAHTLAYVYPPFPPPEIPIAFIDASEYGWMRRGPEIIRQYANAFSPGSMTHDTKNPVEQRKLRAFLEGRSFPYFLREFSKYIEWPNAYWPIDYALYAHSVEPRPPNREEYLGRTEDIFVSWGASHPWRLPITEALRSCNVKGEIHVLEQNGAVRLPQSVYFPKTRAAKCSVSADGYGSGSFRMTEVLVRTLLLQGPLQIYTRAPLIDGVTCREYNIDHNGMDFVATNIGDVMCSALADPEGSYAIYERGYHHCNEHLSERATATYVLDVISKHDYSKPTQLDIPV